jgi:hypothetical protein
MIFRARTSNRLRLWARKLNNCAKKNNFLGYKIIDIKNRVKLKKHNFHNKIVEQIRVVF